MSKLLDELAQNIENQKMVKQASSSSEDKLEQAMIKLNASAELLDGAGHIKGSKIATQLMILIANRL